MHTRRLFFVVVVSAIFLALAGCVTIPSGKSGVNRSVFQSKQEFEARITGLYAGMAEDEFFQQLGIQPDMKGLEIEYLGTDYFYTLFARYSSSGNEVQLEDMLKSYHGWRIPYISIAKKWGLGGPLSVMTVRKGHRLKITAIFKDGNLIYAPKAEGERNSLREEERYIWDYFIGKNLK